MTSRPLAVLLLASCSGSATDNSDAGPDAGTDGGARATCSSLPDLPAGVQAQWILDQINGDPTGITATEYDSHVTPGYAANISLSRFAGDLATIAASGTPFVFAGMAVPSQDGLVGPIFSTAGTDIWGIGVSVDPALGDRIDGLTVELAPSRSQLDAAFATSSPRVSYLIAEITTGGCQPIYAYQSTSRLALSLLCASSRRG